jgi:prepilin-type N-terminal cleavage/methylation domain-containing protein/prepilin-type processing-associated H-X9-DG protein
MKTKHRAFGGKAVTRGFTLVELLVVILIIITVSALTLIGINKMRQSANKAVAVRNISQLHVANAGYASEHNGKYMPVYAFDKDSKIATMWFCSPMFLDYLGGSGSSLKSMNNENTVPINMMDPAVVLAKKSKYDSYDASFGYNHEGIDGSYWGDPNAERSFRVQQIVSPGRSAAFLTATDWIAKYSGRFAWKGAGAVEGKTEDGKIAFRHGGKALVVYYDGHVGEITMADLKRIDSGSDPKGDKNLFWNADGL